jgi:hypothetical protein
VRACVNYLKTSKSRLLTLNHAVREFRGPILGVLRSSCGRFVGLAPKKRTKNAKSEIRNPCGRNQCGKQVFPPASFVRANHCGSQIVNSRSFWVGQEREDFWRMLGICGPLRRKIALLCFAFVTRFPFAHPQIIPFPVPFLENSKSRGSQSPKVPKSQSRKVASFCGSVPQNLVPPIDFERPVSAFL